MVRKPHYRVKKVDITKWCTNRPTVYVIERVESIARCDTPEEAERITKLLNAAKDDHE